ncbi:uncharacterized protein LOC130893309 isoform X2 [Diorhabda carinulata]|uniref:uncharacterized protein LOC130893309 isoform X2 n=1 Tax=Diorhabda carinulata TaxID=1163345 RepID=UPI0025A1431F|nr:uncharacterized protein LOC130893309 isoform X2 [Diorhabda carinulata]
MNQNKRILKQPGKAIFYLLTIMFLIVRESHEVNRCFQNCFGPVIRIKIYNQLSQGYLHVNGSNVVATSDEEDGIIYKISAGRNFYLYDMKAEKFICWKKAQIKKRHRAHTSLIAKKHSSKSCQFRDMVAKEMGGYVNLVAAFNTTLKMKFNRKGKFASHDCAPKTHTKCPQQSIFLIQVYEDIRSEDGCKCPEARHHFCKARFSKMKVFGNICNQSNETFDL